MPERRAKVNRREWEREQARMYRKLRPGAGSLKEALEYDSRTCETKVSEIEDALKITAAEIKKRPVFDYLRLCDEVSDIATPAVHDLMEDLYSRGMSKATVLSALLNVAGFEAEQIIDPLDDDDDEIQPALLHFAAPKVQPKSEVEKIAAQIASTVAKIERSELDFTN
jgi:hypothetical protein